MPPTPLPPLPRPSTWFTWHDYLIQPGTRVLDVACGDGRHSLAAAARGAKVTAVDRDSAKLESGRKAALLREVSVDWVQADLEGPWRDFGVFEAVLVFNYLDRARMPQMIEAIAPGGVLVMETFLELQRELGWGPESSDHLLRPGELSSLVNPLEAVHGREAVEPVGADRWRAVASIVAQRL